MFAVLAAFAVFAMSPVAAFYAVEVLPPPRRLPVFLPVANPGA